MSSPNSDKPGNIFNINGGQNVPAPPQHPNLDDLNADQQLILGYLTFGIPADQIADFSEELEPRQVSSGLDSIFDIFGISPDAEDKPAAALEIFTRLVAEERQKREREQLALPGAQQAVITQGKHLKRIK